MSVAMNIGTGCGLSGATGVRPFLPPLLAGALARSDTGINFSGTPYDFLETPAFLAAVFAAAVVVYLLERRRAANATTVPRRADPVDVVVGVLGVALGALLFAGSLSQGHHEGWPGLIAGVACAALGYAGLALLFARARRRVQGTASGLIDMYAEGIALLLAGVSIAAPPVGYAALVAFAVLLVRARAQQGHKFEGLRILR